MIHFLACLVFLIFSLFFTNNISFSDKDKCLIITLTMEEIIVEYIICGN